MTKIHKKIVCLTKIFTVTFRFSPPTVGMALYGGRGMEATASSQLFEL